MKYIAAYLLLVLGGNKTPDADAVKSVLSSVGVEAEDDKLTKLLGDLKDKNIAEVLENGLQQLSSVPSGGSSSGGSSSGAAEEEEKKEEEEEEEEEEVAVGGLMGGDDDGW